MLYDTILEPCNCILNSLLLSVVHATGFIIINVVWHDLYEKTWMANMFWGIQGAGYIISHSLVFSHISALTSYFALFNLIKNDCIKCFFAIFAI